MTQTNSEAPTAPPSAPSEPPGSHESESSSPERAGLEGATPHDALFHFAFVNPKHAAAELQCVLPPGLVATVDWSSLTPEPGRFVDAKLKSRYSDLLFSARIGRRRGLLYLLFEHVSSRRHLELLKLLEYMVCIWQDQRKSHPKAKRLPVIVPVVLHHSASGWTTAKRFRDLLDIEPESLTELQPFIPDFQAVFDDISRVDSKALKARPMTPEGKLVLFCLRFGRTPDELIASLPDWSDVLLTVANGRVGGLFISAMMQYLEDVTKLGEAGLNMAIEQTLGSSVAERILFAGERLIERGRREGELAGLRKGELAGLRKGELVGRREGELAGQRALLLRQLGQRFGALPDAAVACVQAATSSELDLIATRVLTATTLDEALGKKKRRRGTPPRRG